jgi:hypothetical protein
MPTVVSVFDFPSDVAAAVTQLRSRGFDDLTTYSPAPFAEIESAEDSAPSGVRGFTLVGGLTGVVLGFALQIWMSLDWPLKIGGKAYASIPAYVIIGFELTILLGGLATLLGLLIVGRLMPRRLDPAYDKRFSAEEFGVAVQCEARDVEEIDALMRSHTAKEVSVLDA